MATSPSPADLASTPAVRRYSRELQRVRQTAIQEGREEYRKAVLDWLEAKYMDLSNEELDEKGRALLELTRELSSFLSGKQL